MIRLITRFHNLFHRGPFLDRPCRICAWLWDHLLRDEAFAAELAQGIADIEAGRFHKWTDIRRGPGSVTYTVTVGDSDDSQVGPTPLT